MSGNLKSSHKGWFQLLAMLAVGFVLTALIACNQISQPVSTTNISMTPTQASATNSPYVNTDATQQAADDQLATYEVAQRTSVAPTTIIFDITKTAIALTPINLRATFTPYPTEPIATPQLGILSDTMGFGGSAYAILNYWRGTVDGQLGGVAAGRWRYGRSSKDDINQGIVIVFKRLYWSFPTYDEIYNTPIKVGGMLITSVSGTQVTLSESVYDAASNSIIPLPGGATAVFDIATRQFLSAQCGQNSSSCTPVPIGTTTPVSTPLPTAVATPPLMQTATIVP